MNSSKIAKIAKIKIFYKKNFQKNFLGPLSKTPSDLDPKCFCGFEKYKKRVEKKDGTIRDTKKGMR